MHWPTELARMTYVLRSVTNSCTGNSLKYKPCIVILWFCDFCMFHKKVWLMWSYKIGNLCMSQISKFSSIFRLKCKFSFFSNVADLVTPSHFCPNQICWVLCVIVNSYWEFFLGENVIWFSFAVLVISCWELFHVEDINWFSFAVFENSCFGRWNIRAQSRTKQRQKRPKERSRQKSDC